MYNNDLVELGKELDRNSKEIKHSSRRATKLNPIIEKSKDLVGSLYTYKMEFYTYGDESSVTLDIFFFEKVKNLIYG